MSDQPAAATPARMAKCYPSFVATTPPPCVASVLWDVDRVSLDVERDAEFLMERVMVRGTWDAMRWLRATYSREALSAFLVSRGVRVLAPRELAYWALVTDTALPVATGGGRPKWAGA